MLDKKKIDLIKETLHNSSKCEDIMREHLQKKYADDNEKIIEIEIDSKLLLGIGKLVAKEIEREDIEERNREIEEGIIQMKSLGKIHGEVDLNIRYTEKEKEKVMRMYQKLRDTYANDEEIVSDIMERQRSCLRVIYAEIRELSN